MKQALLSTRKVGFIGAGNMGEALIKGILSGRSLRKQNIIASDIDPKKRTKMKRKYGVRTCSDNRKLIRFADVILIAVKPQDMNSVLEDLGRTVTPGKVVISIAAGIPIKRIERYIKVKVPVIRVMPNTPALVGAGAAAITRGSFAKKAHEDIARAIFEAVGEVVIIRDEKLMDAVTALSGSGPAYFFYLMEALLKAGTKLGLDQEAALKLASQTALGSAKLLMETGIAPEVLRKKVTSKGGTTEAAMKILQKYNVNRAVQEAVKAAAKRSRELSRVV